MQEVCFSPSLFSPDLSHVDTLPFNHCSSTQLYPKSNFPAGHWRTFAACPCVPFLPFPLNPHAPATQLPRSHKNLPFWFQPPSPRRNNEWCWGGCQSPGPSFLLPVSFTPREGCAWCVRSPSSREERAARAGGKEQLLSSAKLTFVGQPEVQPRVTFSAVGWHPRARGIKRCYSKRPCLFFFFLKTAVSIFARGRRK